VPSSIPSRGPFPSWKGGDSHVGGAASHRLPARQRSQASEASFGALMNSQEWQPFPLSPPNDSYPTATDFGSTGTSRMTRKTRFRWFPTG